MMSTVIKVSDLSKQYRLGQVSTGTISHDVNRWWHRMRGKDDPYLKIGEANDRTSIGSTDYVWALKDINFEVRQGEVLGIIGRNGAGKSTLLKILSRTTAPTEGIIKIKGRVASLLEVGTGFHPELSGRENIFLNGAILGMTKKEITRKFDEIVAFAGVERYIDTPVKRYSSGMYVRLAFAVAAHLEPEILIVDEVLAVGDAEFQKKCLGKMKDVSEKDGRTVLFVSHDMNAIINLCPRVLLMNQGKIQLDDTTNKVVSSYKKGNAGITTKWHSHKDVPEAHFSFVEIKIIGDQPRLLLNIKFSIKASIQHKTLFAAFDLCNSLGLPVMQAIPQADPFINFKNGEQNFECEIELNGLIPDSYFISAWIGEHNNLTLDWQKEILSFEIINSPILGRTIPHSYSNGFIIPSSKLITH